MKKTFSTIGVLMAILLLASIASSAVAENDRIKLLNPPPDGIFYLDVGESYSFDIEIASGPSFILAMAMPDAYYPGRGVIWHGNGIAHRDNAASLQLTMTARGSTAELPAICDWPEPGVCWPEGVAPVSIVTGVRFVGGVVLSERFDFYVVVP